MCNFIQFCFCVSFIVCYLSKIVVSGQLWTEHKQIWLASNRKLVFFKKPKTFCWFIALNWWNLLIFWCLDFKVIICKNNWHFLHILKQIFPNVWPSTAEWVLGWHQNKPGPSTMVQPSTAKPCQTENKLVQPKDQKINSNQN